MEEIAEQVHAILEDWKQHCMPTDNDHVRDDVDDALAGETKQNEVRRCLRRLDRALNALTALCNAHMSALSNPNDAPNAQAKRIRPEDVPPALRTNLFNILSLQVRQLGVLQNGDANIRELYASVCHQSYVCLGVFVADEHARPLQSDEAHQVVERIIDFLQRGRGPDNSLARLCDEELAVLGQHLDIINHALFNDHGSLQDKDSNGDDQPGEDNGSQQDALDDVKYISSESSDMASGNSTASSKDEAHYPSRFEALLGGSVPMMFDLFDTLFPAAIFGMEHIRWQPSFHTGQLAELHSRLRDFAGIFLQHVFDSAKLHKMPSVLDLFQAITLHSMDQVHMVDEREVKRLSIKRLDILQKYVYELVDYAFEAFDQAKLFFQSSQTTPTNQTEGNASQRDASANRNHVIIHCAKLGYLAYSALDYMNEFGMIVDKPKIASIRSLWTTYTKVFLAAHAATPSGDGMISVGGDDVDSLVALGQLALTVNPPSGTIPPMDNDLKQCLSVTFLAAIRFPHVLLKNDRFLSVIELLALENRAIRHLVQGVALRQQVFPTSGNAVDPNAMNQVVHRLVAIGLAKPHATIANDPWDSFFREQLSIISSKRKRLARSRGRRGY